MRQLKLNIRQVYENENKEKDNSYTFKQANE